MKAQKECLENELKQCQDDSIMTIKRLQVRPQDSFSTHPQRVSTTLLINYLYFKDTMEKLQEQQDISQIKIRELEGTNNNVNKFGTFNGFCGNLLLYPFS